MGIDLYEHQKLAIEELRTGSILCGGVGSGKSRTAIAYYFVKECEGKLKVNGKGGFAAMKKPKDLFIITTARKRDTLEWEHECIPFLISTKPEISLGGVKVVVDSWNNLSKYIHIKNAFFIFDEQRVIGSGTWVKAFLKLTKVNHWILLSATPGDTWTDYIPVFVANNFYKNRTEFLRRHAVYNRFTRYPKIEKYIECDRLIWLRDQITVIMRYSKATIAHDKSVFVSFDREVLMDVLVRRWNIFEDRPVKAVGELCYLMRKIVNRDPSRCEAIKKIIEKHPKIIIFYNFDYELEILRQLSKDIKIVSTEWNGHLHELIAKGESWMYLVQYSAGAEGWNCIETDTIVFYSQNYSYKVMVQAAGRIDRINTSYSDLYYYHLTSTSVIDLAIRKALLKKKDFSVLKFMDI
jgi:hypothetical protein